MEDTKRDGRDERWTERERFGWGAPSMRPGESNERERESQNNRPTPRTKGMCGGTGNFEQMKKLEAEGVITEVERKGMTAGNGGKLNPDWGEVLMGWGKGWTKLDETAIRWFEAMRKLRRGSGKKTVQETAGRLDGVPPTEELLADVREQPQDAQAEKLPLASAEASEAGVRGVRPD